MKNSKQLWVLNQDKNNPNRLQVIMLESFVICQTIYSYANEQRENIYNTKTFREKSFLLTIRRTTIYFT